MDPLEALAQAASNPCRFTRTERIYAPLLHRALQEVQAALTYGERSAAEALRHGRRFLDAADVRMALDHFGAVDPATLDEAGELSGGVVVLAAVRLPSPRLIDNIVLDG